MALRPARVYREWKRPYTRTAVRVHKKSYIKGVPGIKLRIFEMGNKTGDFDKIVYLRAKDNVQIRHNALESARVAANAYIKKNMDDSSYHMKVNVYPHQVLREHAQAAIAQADRFYQGMSHPFGRPKARAARVKAGKDVIMIRTNEDKIPVVKEALRRAKMKLPKDYYIEVVDV